MGLEGCPLPHLLPRPQIPTTAGLTVSAAEQPCGRSTARCRASLVLYPRCRPRSTCTGYMLLQARLGPNRMSCNWTRALSLAPLWEPGTELSLPRAAEGGFLPTPRRLLLPGGLATQPDPLSGRSPAASRPASSGPGRAA